MGGLSGRAIHEYGHGDIQFAEPIWGWFVMERDDQGGAYRRTGMELAGTYTVDLNNRTLWHSASV